MSDNYYKGARTKYWGGLAAALSAAVFAAFSSDAKSEENFNPADHDPDSKYEVQANKDHNTLNLK